MSHEEGSETEPSNDPRPVHGPTEDGEWEIVHDDETQDDAVIGKAFRVSMLVLVAIAAVVGAVFLLKPGERAAPEVEIETEAPVAVQEAESVPSLPFTDMIAETGIDFVLTTGAYGDKLLPETMAGGVALFDMDGDNDADLLLVDGGRWPHQPVGPPVPTLRLYRNDGAFAFTDVTEGSGLADFDPDSLYGMGVAVGDVDGDGDDDVFITGVGRNRLFENLGAGRFKDITDTAGVSGDENEWSTSAGFFDIDGDGDLDLMVCNYVRWSKEIDFELDYRLTGIGRAFGRPQSYEGTFPYLYRNNGDGTFTDISAEAGVRVENPATGGPVAKALALAISDVDGDGLMDVLVANDTVQNFFFHNTGGAFEELGELVGLAYDRDGNATGAMGVDVGHYRNDRNLGFLIGNFANEMSSAYVSQDDPLFYVDESIVDGIGAPSRRYLTFGLFLFDVDLDGRLDLFQANGHVESEINLVDPSQSHAQAAQLFWNAGNQGFEPLAPEESGDLGHEVVGRGAAYADLDGDGDLDVVMTQIEGPPLILRNDQALDNHWLRIKLVNKSPNTGAIGAWVEVEAGGTTQRRQVMPTRSYMSQVESILTFGLGKATAIDKIRVQWPDGTRQELDPLPVDQLHIIERGG